MVTLCCPVFQLLYTLGPAGVGCSGLSLWQSKLWVICPICFSEAFTCSSVIIIGSMKRGLPCSHSHEKSLGSLIPECEKTGLSCRRCGQGTLTFCRAKSRMAKCKKTIGYCAKHMQLYAFWCTQLWQWALCVSTIVVHRNAWVKWQNPNYFLTITNLSGILVHVCTHVAGVALDQGKNCWECALIHCVDGCTQLALSALT